MSIIVGVPDPEFGFNGKTLVYSLQVAAAVKLYIIAIFTAATIGD